MYFLFSFCLELFSPAITIIPVSVIFGALFHWNSRRTVVCALFAFYLAVVWAIVGIPNVTYIRFDPHMNLIPFRGFFSGLRGSLLNILLFWPLGFLLPLLWQCFHSCKNTVLMGFGLSLTIELLQIFTYRATDINDLMTNTFGTWIGWLCAIVFMRKIPAAWDIAAKSSREVFALMTASLAVMFLVHPFVLSLLQNSILQ